MVKNEMSARSVCHIDCLREINENLHWMCCIAICECLRRHKRFTTFLVIPFKSFSLNCYQLHVYIAYLLCKMDGLFCVSSSLQCLTPQWRWIFACSFFVTLTYFIFLPFTSILSLQSIYKIRNVVVSCICVLCAVFSSLNSRM